MLELEPKLQPEHETNADFAAWEQELGESAQASGVADDELDFDFAAWEDELDEDDLALQAQEAFAEILTLENAEGETRTIQDVQNEVRAFLSNPTIVALEGMVDQMVMQFAAFCNHNHVDEGSLNSDMQDLIKSKKAQEEANQNNTDEDEEIDPITGKPRKKRRGWLNWFMAKK